jgi:hypothetical protein
MGAFARALAWSLSGGPSRQMPLWPLAPSAPELA